MAANTKISNAAAIAACDAIVDLIDGGDGAGKLLIYDGSQPAGPDVDVTDQTLLAELTLSNPAFGNAEDANPGGRATANEITGDSSADESGTATWFRVVDGDGTAIIDGSVGTSDADLILGSVTVTQGVQVNITSWTVTVPES